MECLIRREWKDYVILMISNVPLIFIEKFGVCISQFYFLFINARQHLTTAAAGNLSLFSLFHSPHMRTQYDKFTRYRPTIGPTAGKTIIEVRTHKTMGSKQLASAIIAMLIQIVETVNMNDFSFIFNRSSNHSTICLNFSKQKFTLSTLYFLSCC